MTKGRVLKLIFATVFIILIMVSVALYVVDIITNGTPIEENLFKMLSAVFVSLAGLARLISSGKRGRRSLEYYASQYEEHVKNAFVDEPLYRKKLLCALRLYNENNLRKALKYLLELKKVCKKHDDACAVGLFLGLTLTDMGLAEEAISEYNQLIALGITSSTVYGNLGHLHSNLGNYDDAIANLRLSIQNDAKNPAPYHNLANLYFSKQDFENAKKYALEALEVNFKFRQSASLLAIIFSLEGDVDNAKKYSHISISCGEDPEKLKRAIEHYKAAQAVDREETSEELETVEE